MGGGTGGGCGMRILNRCSIEYAKKTRLGFQIFGDCNKSVSAMMIYNQLMTLHWLNDHIDASIILGINSYIRYVERDWE